MKGARASREGGQGGCSVAAKSSSATSREQLGSGQGVRKRRPWKVRNGAMEGRKQRPWNVESDQKGVGRSSTTAMERSGPARESDMRSHRRDRGGLMGRTRERGGWPSLILSSAKQKSGSSLPLNQTEKVATSNQLVGGNLIS
jgi:hypothetical protein